MDPRQTVTEHLKPQAKRKPQEDPATLAAIQRLQQLDEEEERRLLQDEIRLLLHPSDN